MEAILAFETSMNHLCNFVIILVEQKCAPLFQGKILISDHSPKSICLSENYLILAKNWKSFVFLQAYIVTVCTVKDMYACRSRTIRSSKTNPVFPNLQRCIYRPKNSDSRMRAWPRIPNPVDASTRIRKRRSHGPHSLHAAPRHTHA
jgi:hypothetical protein